MRLALIQLGEYDNLGAQAVAAAANGAGHTADIFIAAGKRIDGLADFRPDVLGFSCTSGVHRWALETAGRLREAMPGVPTIFGGAHPTYFPELARRPEVDVVCRGEGDDAIVDYLDALAGGDDHRGIDNLGYVEDGELIVNELRPLEQDLDRFPFIFRGHYRRYRGLRTNTFRIFLASRGCPFDCSFCYAPTLRAMYSKKGKLTRFRSPELVAAEALQVRAQVGLDTVDFADDLFTVKRSWLREFCEVWKREVNLPFTVAVRADLIDEEKTELLVGAGCTTVSFGVEAGNAEIREKVLGKRIDNEQFIKAATLLRRSGVDVRCYNMVGNPGETIEQAWETVELNRAMRPTHAWASVFQPYAGTPAANALIESGNLRAEDLQEVDSTFHRTSVLNQPDIDRCINLHKFFWLAVKYPRLEPLIRRLIELPPNRLYALFFSAGFFLMHGVRARLSLGRLLASGGSLLRVYLGEGSARVRVRRPKPGEGERSAGGRVRSSAAGAKAT